MGRQSISWHKTVVLLLVLVLCGVAAPQNPFEEPALLQSNSLTKPGSEKESSAIYAHFLGVPRKKLFEYLQDPDKKIPPLFKIPEPIFNTVGFWFLIYTKFSAYHNVLYDKEHPEHIYEIIDNTDLFKKGASAVLIEITSRKRLHTAINGYKKAFAVLKSNPRARFSAGSYGANLIQAWGRLSKKEWAHASDNLRTQAGQRDRIMQGIRTADPFLPAMESIFKKYNLPTELTRIPLVESSFNTTAVSKADAVGVWQFLEKSALEYLVVDDKNDIDERLSPIKSTYAAARMFKRNYILLKDYGLAIIAYNHGPRNLVRIRHKFKGSDIAKLLTLKKGSPLGYASKNYYSEFLAILHAEKYREELYGLPEVPARSAISIVRMKKPTSIFEIASLYKTSLFELRLYNPDIFNMKKRLPSGTRVVIPRKIKGSLVYDSTRLNDVERSIASQLEVVEDINE